MAAKSPHPKPLRVRAYECKVKYFDWRTTVHAETASKARYRYWLHVREPYPDVRLIDIEVLSCGPPVTDDKFRRIAEYRGVPFAHVGMRVIACGKPGVLVGANDSSNFDVLFEGGVVGNCHPNYQMEYLSDGR